jgi:ABC-type branched-subunit amino acid transport system substrate-binding protein
MTDRSLTRVRAGRPGLLALVLAFFALAFPPAATAQTAGPTPYRVTVIVSDVGADADRGRLERRVAEAWAARQRGRGGIFGRPLSIDVVSDGGTPAGALRRAEEAVATGAHALVCCSGEAASLRVAALAHEARLPLLAPAGALPQGGPTWAFALEPDDATALQATVRDAYARGLLKLGLATLEGPFGDEVRARLDGFLAAPGLEIASEVRYPPDATVLTPEALQLAVRQPDVVLLWGLRRDGLLALEGLRARGWTGPVYLRPAAWGADAGGLPGVDAGDVRLLVSPASLPEALAAGDPAMPWIAEARALGAGRLESRPLRADGARMHDALTLLGLAFEQVETYGIDVAVDAVTRSALRDALLGLPPRQLAAGGYDLRDDDPRAATPDGSRAVRVDGPRLVPLR